MKEHYWKNQCKLFLRPCGPTSTNTDMLPTLYLIEMPSSSFANRVDPDQAALVRAA